MCGNYLVQDYMTRMMEGNKNDFLLRMKKLLMRKLNRRQAGATKKAIRR